MFHVGYTIPGVWKLLRRHGPGAPAAGDRTRRRGDRGVQGRGVAAGERTVVHLGARICFEDEAGQGLRPPKGRTWAPRGARPVVRVRGRNRGRVNFAGVACYHAGHRSRFFFKCTGVEPGRGDLVAPASGTWPTSPSPTPATGLAWFTTRSDHLTQRSPEFSFRYFW
ncbi:hypothetical protein AB0I77_50385 [Streptomyces sp. NPDC050619]|uniref:hypothetical protein n=1 Tax=Streptomyces sp. NPDC050619 TaxID=3157214 RepID=UPI003443BF63